MLQFCIFPGYRFCGPGCSGPGDPKNDVDALCKAHDECLEAGGSQCECDREFRDQLRKKINLTSEEGIVAAIMYVYMSIQVFFTCLFFRNAYR